MTEELTTQQYVVVLRDSTFFYITEEQKNSLFTGLQMNGSDQIFSIGDNLVTRQAILFITTAANYEETLRRKRGEWKDKFGEWHKYNERSRREDKEKLEMVDLLDSHEQVSIKEILEDQRKNGGKYTRDNERSGWVRTK